LKRILIPELDICLKSIGQTYFFVLLLFCTLLVIKKLASTLAHDDNTEDDAD